MCPIHCSHTCEVHGRSRDANLRIILTLGRALAILLALVFSSCGGTDAENGRLKVVASIYPLADAARQVTGDLAEVQSLTPPGVEAHDLELGPAEVDAIEEADVVLIVRGLQPPVDGATRRARGTVVDVLPATADGENPHRWLDPVRMAAGTRLIGAALVAADPDHTVEYRSSMHALARALGDLHRDFEKGLVSCRSKTIVTSHAAFDHLAQRYGLRQEAIAGVNPEAEPDAKRLAELTELIRREGITTVFSEPRAPDDPAKTLAREAHVEVASLDPIEGPPASSEGSGYVTAMRANLKTLRSALGCT